MKWNEELDKIIASVEESLLIALKDTSDFIDIIDDVDFDSIPAEADPSYMLPYFIREAIEVKINKQKVLENIIQNIITHQDVMK